jgi:hypothetical protein
MRYERVKKNRESFRENVNNVFKSLFKFQGKSHTLIVKSPIDLYLFFRNFKEIY